MTLRPASLALALALGSSGCASILNGTKQDVWVSSDSPSATVRVDGNAVTTGSVEVSRGHEHVFTAEAPGTRPVSVRTRPSIAWGPALADAAVAIFLFPVGLVAPIVDFVDGAIYDQEPDRVNLPAPAAEAPARSAD